MTENEHGHEDEANWNAIADGADDQDEVIAIFSVDIGVSRQCYDPLLFLLLPSYLSLDANSRADSTIEKADSLSHVHH